MYFFRTIRWLICRLKASTVPTLMTVLKHRSFLAMLMVANVHRDHLFRHARFVMVSIGHIAKRKSAR